MPTVAKDSKFVHCSYCDQRFRFEYDAKKHEHEQHPEQAKK